MRVYEIEWKYQADSVPVGMTWHGQGELVPVLPALQFNFNSKRDVAAAGTLGIALHNVSC